MLVLVMRLQLHYQTAMQPGLQPGLQPGSLALLVWLDMKARMVSQFVQLHINLT